MIRRDSGSSLIWFISLLAITMMVLLALVTASHMFLFARKLHDYTEQVALSGKTWLIQGTAINNLEGQLATLPRFPAPIISKAITYSDGKTLQLRICSKWISPITLVPTSAQICEEAKAR